MPRTAAPAASPSVPTPEPLPASGALSDPAAPKPARATATVRRKQADRRQDAERKLLESGLEVIAQKGVSAMTLNEVGERAGYSRGLVAHHYGNKDGFVNALVDYIRSRFRESQRAAPKLEPGLDQLLANVDIYLMRTGAHSQAVNAMMTEAIRAGGVLQARMREFSAVSRDFFGAQIRIAKEKGQIRADVDPDTLATMLLGMLRGVAGQYLIDRERVDIAAIRKEAELLIRRLLAR